mgnify:CR=1 FL=1
MNQKVLKTLEYYKIIERLTDCAASEPGKKMCRELTPSSDFNEIVQAQTETADAVTRVRQKGSLSLAGVRDVRDSLKRLEIGSSLSIMELLSVSGLLTCAARAKNYGRHPENTELPDDSLDEMFRTLEPLTNVNSEITRCILGEDEIADDASPGLHHVRRQMKITADKVHTQLNAILNSSRTMLQDAVITMRDGRYCLPVRAEYKSQFAGMVHDQSSTGSTLFIEPMAIIKLNNELRELELKEQKEIEMILAALSTELVPYIEPITTDFEILTKLDFIFAKAALARIYNCSMPKFNRKGYIHIKDGRHPVVEKMISNDMFICNDTYLNDKKERISIITGPNMAGKSALLRQTALITLMAQIGCFVPAESAHIGIVDKIFTRVGASDNISVGESTFMVEMNEASDILNNMTSRSLVLFDELGRGTSTYDGISIAWAIVEYIHEHPNAKAKTLFATHYHELNEMERAFKRIKNYNVSVKEVGNKVIFLRKLIPGGSEHSFGIHVAKMAGMPKSIVKRSNEILKQLESENRQEGIGGKPVKAIASAAEGYQLSFFQLDDPVLSQVRDEIKNLDVNNLTPLEALNKLSEIKRIITGK